jgi:hypothetical protein
MTEQITVRPLVESVFEEANLSPYQARLARAPEIANDDFLGSFSDVLDAINPLQHIPIVSTLYREISGSSISQGAKLIGDTLFGGPLGFLSSLFSSIMEDVTGNDLGGHLIANAADKYEKTSQLN